MKTSPGKLTKSPEPNWNSCYYYAPKQCCSCEALVKKKKKKRGEMAAIIFLSKHGKVAEHRTCLWKTQMPAMARQREADTLASSRLETDGHALITELNFARISINNPTKMPPLVFLQPTHPSRQ